MDLMGSGIAQPPQARSTPPMTERVPSRRGSRPRWRPLAVSAAVLVTAGAVVAFTAMGARDIICGQRLHRTTSTSLALPTLSLPTSAAASATCVAWPSIKRSIDAVSALPEGWYWNRSVARSDITDMAAAVSLDLDHFHSQIATTDPAPIAGAAQSYISAEYTELSTLTDHTFDDAVAADVASARSELNRACGMPSHRTATI